LETYLVPKLDHFHDNPPHGQDRTHGFLLIPVLVCGLLRLAQEWRAVTSLLSASVVASSRRRRVIKVVGHARGRYSYCNTRTGRAAQGVRNLDAASSLFGEGWPPSHAITASSVPPAPGDNECSQSAAAIVFTSTGRMVMSPSIWTYNVLLHATLEEESKAEGSTTESLWEKR
jgi:hypothetical protein